jgi:hypothetical protein
VECVSARRSPFQHTSQLVFREVATRYGERLYFDNGAVFGEKRMKVSRRVIVPVHDDPHAINDCDCWHFRSPSREAAQGWDIGRVILSDHEVDRSDH